MHDTLDASADYAVGPSGYWHLVTDAAAGPGDPTPAVHDLEVAVEWVERAYGALLEFHHGIGRAQRMLHEAADALDEAGQGALAARLRDDLADAEVIPGHWTFQMVDEFRAGFLSPLQAFGDEVRDRLTDGERHRFEAAEKRRRLGASTRR